MANEIYDLPLGMTMIPGTDNYGTLFDSSTSNLVEMNDLDSDSYWKTKVFDKMYSDNMKEKHKLLFRSKISRDPSNIGGDECKFNINSEMNKIMFSGKIAWQDADPDTDRVAGNRVGVMISFSNDLPTEYIDDLKVRISGKVYDNSVLDEVDGKKVLQYSPLVKSNEDSFKVELIWGSETNIEEFWIFISPTSSLESKII